MKPLERRPDRSLLQCHLEPLPPRGRRRRQLRERGAGGGPPAETASGSTSAGGRPPRKGFNPAWLLVPAVGLLLGGLGIADMNRRPVVETTPTVTVTGPATTIVQPVAPVGSATNAPGCSLQFIGVQPRPPTGQIRNDQTGQVMNAPSGREFVVVETTLTNSGTDDCYATPGYQRVYTSGGTYYTGSREAGDQLAGGRLVTRPVAPGKSIAGAYVFEVPSGSKASSVRLRGNGSEQWTIVNAG